MGSRSRHSLDPRHETTRARARWATDDGDLETAVRDYQLVTDLEPRNVGAAEAFARVLAASGRTEAAAAESLRLAALHAATSNPREALAAAERAWTLDPAAFERHRVAALLTTLGSPIETICRRAIEQHLAARRHVSARDLLQLLVEFRPRSAELRERLAAVELELGRTDQALRCLRAVARLHRLAGDTEAFGRTAERLLALGGPDPELLRELVAGDLRANRLGLAVERLEQLQRLRPADLVLLESLAALQAKLGRTPSALESLWRLVRALRREGDDERVRDLLRRARRWHGSTRHHEAIDALARKVLPARDASHVSAPGWLLVQPVTRRPSQPAVAATPPSRSS
ncbi:MAG: hypothetical protein KDK70_15415 [Myxococcales bacterium]|nr:hypothetical protein [Myxococcales bacterium]